MAMYLAPLRVTCHDRTLMHDCRMLSCIRRVAICHSPGTGRIDCRVGQTDDRAEAEKYSESKCFFHDFLEVGHVALWPERSNAAAWLRDDRWRK
jgi:hypothetical protein